MRQQGKRTRLSAMPFFADKRPLSNPNKPNPTTKKQTNRSKMMMNFDLEQMR